MVRALVHVMMAALLAGGAPGAWAGGEGEPPPPIVTPSGLSLHWVQTLQDSDGPEGLTLRLRFLAPAIAGGVADFAPIAADMQWLCETLALPLLPQIGRPPAQIVISLSDRDLPFGETDDTATQFFEAYRPDPPICDWDMF